LKPTICVGPTIQRMVAKDDSGHQVALAVAHVEREDVVGLHAAGIVGLHDHALHAAAVGKVVDVGRAQIGRDGAVDVLEGHAERRGLLAIDDQLDLRRRRQSLDIDVLQDRALFSQRSGAGPSRA
jgi:hypothetical protein